MKKCGLYLRVSTDRQARVEEGSLKNQEYLLTQQVQMKDQIGKDQWSIVDKYIDEGLSAKDTNRPEFQRMLGDIKNGRINAVICKELSRISRSTRDLLDLIEFFQENAVDFICLKEDVDTTSPMGRLLLTFMGGLNQFEREQTGERTRAAFIARAQRGLWNGGQLLGYNIDHAKKGSLLINEGEAEIVRFAYKTYLEVGSILATRDRLNQAGFKTKGYTSRRNTRHEPGHFTHASVQQMLNNPAYVGLKTVGAKGASPEDRKLVPAVWPSIIDKHLFDEVQALLRQNLKTRNNGAVAHKHFYLLNGGLLYCNKCGARMEGRNGHGHHKRKAYYYYYCTNKVCRIKLPQTEVEQVMHQLMSEASKDGVLLPKIVAKLNHKLRCMNPKLEAQIKQKEADLRLVQQSGQDLLMRADDVKGGREFVQEELGRLSLRRRQLESELQALKRCLEDRDRLEVDEAGVRSILSRSNEVFGETMKPYKRKELLKLVARRFEISDNEARFAVRVGAASQYQEWSSGQVAVQQPTRGAI